MTVGEPNSASKSRKLEKVRKHVSKKVQNKFLKSPKVLTGRVFDSSILANPSRNELVELIKHQRLIHLMEGPIPSVFDEKVKQFYSTLDFSNDGLKMIALAQGKKLNLDDVMLGRILEVPISSVRTISK